MEGKVFITTNPNQSGNGSESGQNKRKSKWVFIGLLALCVQFVSIIIGWVYINDCPKQRGIPIILIVSGVTAIPLILIIETIFEIKNDRNYDVIKKLVLLFKVLGGLWAVTLIIWMVCVYPNVYPTFDDPNDENYCNKTLFLFAFWLLNISIASILLTAIGFCMLIFSIKAYLDSH